MLLSTMRFVFASVSRLRLRLYKVPPQSNPHSGDVGAGAANTQQQQAPCSAEGNGASFWSGLLGTRYGAAKEGELEQLGKGKRARAPVRYHDFEDRVADALARAAPPSPGFVGGDDDGDDDEVRGKGRVVEAGWLESSGMN